MTRNLHKVTGLGHFLVMLANGGRCNAYADRISRLAPRISDGKVPPAVNRIGEHALVAGWGGVTIDKGEESTAVGVFQRARYDAPAVDAARLHRLFAAHGTSGLDGGQLGGSNFSAVIVHRSQPRALALTAPFRQLPLYRVVLDDLTVFATDARLIVSLGLVPPALDPQALYHYLNFSCVPAPFSIFRKIRKVPAGTQLRATPGTVVEEPYWRPRFDGDRDGSEAVLAEELREEIFSTVRAHRPRGNLKWGAFLSGGTDSSTIAGVLSSEPGREPVSTYSIGFGERGYDELEYARIAANHFDTRPTYRQVNEQDTLAAIPMLLEAYDEPFGNASAVPTYYCAAAAADDDVQVMIAGDGGDENFGGNERYARNAVYRAYASLPNHLRAGLAALLNADSRSQNLFANRVRNFAARGALDNPDRFYREESFASENYDALLTPGFRSEVEKDSSLDMVRRHYSDVPEADELHRLMYVDLMMTIADNDLVKVQRASQAAGVSVTYPYLDTRLVDFTGRLHARWKVNGLRKRYLFKRALRSLLPEQILNKPKLGFGLPIGPWARRPGKFRELMQDSLRSRRALERGYFEAGFIERLLNDHDRGGWNSGPELWRLLMLELWQREYVDGA